ncbi:MAG TPA: ATP phosphoribosyltransferase regulatory subunit [Ktedonobacteraceae bacterium]|nr:ATP phosphoribosyltransferase regulatory subunit [Ktedonobacteraceae bacterium]
MKKHIERLRGMHDRLPETYEHQRWAIDRLSAFLAQAGYDPVDPPILERSELFQSSFGQELWQNLYTFHLHHRDLCMRPEFTASICRLYLDHYQQQTLPIRFQYAGPVFRYETPGRGRYRQHTQLGVELFGGHSISADAEILQLACEALNKLQISSYRLELGHIGVVSGFINRLQLDEHAARLLLSLMEQISRSEEGERLAQSRLETLYPANRPGKSDMSSNNTGIITVADTHLLTSLLSSISVTFGSDDARHEVVERYLWKMERSEQRRRILHALEFLRALHAISGSPPEVFGALRDLLERYKLDPKPLAELEQLVGVIEQSAITSQQIILNLALGRGVSYYTGLVFEIHAMDDEGFDTQLCGGGRYDDLLRAVGGSRDINACGFAFGVERLLPLVPKSNLPIVEKTQALIIPVNIQNMPYALRVAKVAREVGLRVEVDVAGHGVGAGLKLATKKETPWALIVGDDEQQANKVTLHHLVTGEELVLDNHSFVNQISGEERSL